MPSISKFYGIDIRMYFRDNIKHNKPHIHAFYNEYIATFDLEGNIIEGNLPNSQRKLLQAWIEIHKDELKRLWDLFIQGKKGFKIEPLK